MDAIGALDVDTAWAAFMRRDRAWDGRVIGAVKTTGIYCKPSRPAQAAETRSMSNSSSTGDEERGRPDIAPAALQARGVGSDGASCFSGGQIDRACGRSARNSARCSKPSAMRLTISNEFSSVI